MRIRSGFWMCDWIRSDLVADPLVIGCCVIPNLVLGGSTAALARIFPRAGGGAIGDGDGGSGVDLLSGRVLTRCGMLVVSVVVRKDLCQFLVGDDVGVRDRQRSGGHGGLMVVAGLPVQGLSWAGVRAWALRALVLWACSWPGCPWAWGFTLGPLGFISFTVVFYLYYLVCLRYLRAISPYNYCVGLVGLCVCVCTLSALSALGRRRVPCFVKWSLPPSGRVRLSVAGSLRRQHSRKAVLKLTIMLRCNRVTYRVIFPLCHRYVKANRVASRALFASWCFFEYMYYVEIPDIISGHTLDAYCNQGFRLNVPPVYSTVSLIKA
ncbi:hypothetical protein RchiOBHm_Chr4g0423141 [Rosa chinensis]|uniref:Uncharacterized protein n=1 Tax=Rosa chinensis TaxID=74649 RepID=A0A2P6QYP1_ROSCH|nr:hypothetical protein RchiOBHm_Chr4g0423141 [Rosa chinensis]